MTDNFNLLALSLTDDARRLIAAGWVYDRSRYGGFKDTYFWYDDHPPEGYVSFTAEHKSGVSPRVALEITRSRELGEPDNGRFPDRFPDY